MDERYWTVETEGQPMRATANPEPFQTADAYRQGYRVKGPFVANPLDTDDLILMLALIDSLLELQRALRHYPGGDNARYEEARAGIMRLRAKIRGAL